MFMAYGLWLMAYMRGKPTRLAPRPNPAPWRAVTPIEGARTSSRANTAAATRASEAISSRGSDFLGMKMAAVATARPSTRYFKARFTN